CRTSCSSMPSSSSCSTYSSISSSPGLTRGYDCDDHDGARCGRAPEIDIAQSRTCSARTAAALAESWPFAGELRETLADVGVLGAGGAGHRLHGGRRADP